MSEVCTQCGLPKELCVCETIAKESQSIKVYSIKKKFGKLYTVIEGIDEKDIDLKDMAKKLKAKLACGGTAKEGKIELQGNHGQRVKGILINLGFAKEMIEVR
ncbi:translation initiation factor [Candidatus Woesearchaeota archaeon]|nr:translation initiation factor [Candidatus Woesearchaeota archaeon]